jgi:2-methylcitrate dehydratase
MTKAQVLASFVERARFADLSVAAAEQLKIRVLDTIGGALGAPDAGPIGAICKLTVELGGRPLSTLIGGGRTAPDRAAFFNGALSRYLDFMDSYLAEGETCFPSGEAASNSAPASSEATMELSRNGARAGCGADNSWQYMRSILRCISA